MLSACETPVPTQEATIPTPTATDQPTIIYPTPTVETPTPVPSPTPTPGPSPTSTSLPELSPQSWLAKPVMVVAARAEPDSHSPFSYTPLFVLYGDGLLIKRTCQNGNCLFLQAPLDQTELCRLVNAIDLTGFLQADPSAFVVPGGTGAVIQLAVDIYAENTVQISDLDRWSEAPSWYETFAGCRGCFPSPKIDPAFSDLYRLLTTYDDEDMTGFIPERLGVWLTQPVIAGAAQPWSPDLMPLAELEVISTCPDNPSRQSAVIFERPTARMISSFLSEGDGIAPLFTENGSIWQVHSRWLLPYEMTHTCENDAGIFPPPGSLEITWSCSPEFGAIPTSTPTVTPTPTITPTPLR